MALPRPSRLLRIVAVVFVALVLLVWVSIQFQERHFRRQTERLHVEILELQLHPGTFADIQRLQHEWGNHAHYDGPCTVHHCIYNITLNDLDAEAEPGRISPWVLRFYLMLGGHPATTYANVRVRDDRRWGADFGLRIWSYPGKGRNDGQHYVVAAGVDLGSRLLIPSLDLNPMILKQGFRTMHTLQCLGCEFVAASITPQTSASDIRRFNQFNFNCLTQLKACHDPIDLAPELWSAAEHDELSDSYADNYSIQSYCQLPTSVLARESNDVLAVEVRASAGGKATVRVVDTLKNGRSTPPGMELKFFMSPMAVRTDNGDRSDLIVGQQYVFLYRHPQPDDVDQLPFVQPCHALLKTASNVAEVKVGIAFDPSAGEPYDYWNKPYTETSP